MSFFLKVLLAPEQTMVGVRFPLNEGDNIVGRISPPASIRLDSPKVSKRHCTFAVKGADLNVADNQSSNGVYVNGKKVEKAKLTNKDRIVIGEFTLEVAVG